jgi:hypothetical protein
VADEPELRQSTEQWRADLRALANEPERLGFAQSLGEGVDVLDVIVTNSTSCTDSFVAPERAQRVVVIVKSGELHRGPPSARRRSAVLAQVLRPGGGHRDEHAASGRMTTRDEASLVGVFPYGEVRARRPPRLEHVGVGAGVGAHPLEEVEDQGIDGLGHRGPCWIGAGQSITSPGCRRLMGSKLRPSTTVRASQPRSHKLGLAQIQPEVGRSRKIRLRIDLAVEDEGVMADFCQKSNRPHRSAQRAGV